VNARLELALAFALFVACSFEASAQLPPPTIGPSKSRIQAVTIVSNLSETDVTRNPYSAIEESMYSQKQPDGTYVNKTLTVTHIYRDSDGRMRADRYVTSYA
jgi:hypothetical protein